MHDVSGFARLARNVGNDRCSGARSPAAEGGRPAGADGPPSRGSAADAAAVAEDDQRGARRPARPDPGPVADAELVGRPHDDVVHLAVAAGGVDEQVDEVAGARRLGVGRHEELGDVAVDGLGLVDAEQLLGAARDSRRPRACESTSRNGSLGRGRELGAARR